MVLSITVSAQQNRIVLECSKSRSFSKLIQRLKKLPFSEVERPSHTDCDGTKDMDSVSKTAEQHTETA